MKSKKCPKCGKVKSVDQFYKHSKWGLQGYCKSCNYKQVKQWREANHERHLKRYRERSRRRRETSPEKYLVQKRQRQWAKFGFTQGEYDRLEVQQRGRCKICGRKPRRLHVDHDHKTNTFRGLVCMRCNVYMGYIYDSPKTALRLVKYLLGREFDS